jgi:N-acetylneuraminic acid mutarotase
MNRNFILLCLFIFISILFYSCRLDNCCDLFSASGNWVMLGNGKGGISTSGSVSFVIDSNAYITTGIDSAGNYINDTWGFNPANSASWFQQANFPGNGRKFAVAFSIGNKGYVGSGSNGTNALADFWQYDPSQNSWLRMADFPGNARYGAVAFGIAGYGYFTLGTDGTNYFNDFWKYDPSANSWQSIAKYPGIAKSGAVSFVYNNRGFIVTGIGVNGTLANDFYSFDPSRPDSSQWYQLRNITNSSPNSYDDGYTSLVRSYGVGFVMTGTTSDGGGDRAYITTGLGQSSLNNTTWAYNFADSLWNQKTSYERSPRVGAIRFTVQNRGFVGLGSNGSTFFANIDEWKPDEVYNRQD